MGNKAAVARRVNNEPGIYDLLNLNPIKSPAPTSTGNAEAWEVAVNQALDEWEKQKLPQVGQADKGLVKKTKEAMRTLLTDDKAREKYHAKFSTGWRARQVHKRLQAQRLTDRTKGMKEASDKTLKAAVEWLRQQELSSGTKAAATPAAAPRIARVVGRPAGPGTAKVTRVVAQAAPQRVVSARPLPKTQGARRFKTPDWFRTARGGKKGRKTRRKRKHKRRTRRRGRCHRRKRKSRKGRRRR